MDHPTFIVDHHLHHDCGILLQHLVPFVINLYPLFTFDFALRNREPRYSKLFSSSIRLSGFAIPLIFKCWARLTIVGPKLAGSHTRLPCCWYLFPRLKFLAFYYTESRQQLVLNPQSVFCIIATLRTYTNVGLCKHLSFLDTSPLLITCVKHNSEWHSAVLFLYQHSSRNKNTFCIRHTNLLIWSGCSSLTSEPIAFLLRSFFSWKKNKLHAYFKLGPLDSVRNLICD